MRRQENKGSKYLSRLLTNGTTLGMEGAIARVKVEVSKLKKTKRCGKTSEREKEREGIIAQSPARSLL